MRNRNLDELPAPRMEIRLAGSGGQGLILAGLVLAEAAGIYDGREVAMVQSYGPEARGGTSKAEVIISNDPIDYPLCMQVDVLLAMTQEACDAYCWDLKPVAWIIVDKDLVTHPPSSRVVALPFTSVARDKLKKDLTANVVALGTISELTGIVTRRALEKALLNRVPRGSHELNKKALGLGVKLAREFGGLPVLEAKEDPTADERL
ncbi:MAG: 2-oxoacid:acceptor oxidoreductase family protein [Thermodesulfobacteriota bacterium]